MAIKLIRFVSHLEYLIDDLKNGFRLREHPTKFTCSPTETIIGLIEYWNENKISNGFISEVSSMYNSAISINHFYAALASKLKTDSTFKINFSYYSSTIRTIKFKMKCFTELRDNQKLRHYHTSVYGKYGISLNVEWAKKNHADRVIYVDSKAEVSLRLAKLLGVCMTIGKKTALNFVFDLLAFVEIAEHYTEFEWRIVGEHNFVGAPKRNLPEIIPFKLSDISEIFVNEESEIDTMLATIKNKQKDEEVDELPKICLTEDIILTEKDENKINEINERSK